MYIVTVLLKYLCAWFLMLSVLFCALLSEGIYSFIYSGRGRSGFLAPLRFMAKEARRPIVLPDTARFAPSLYGPALSFAALLPICASIPFCTLVPVLDNGGDLIQIFMFAMLANVMAVVSVYSLGTASGDAAARSFIKDTFCNMFLMMACFASLAFYLETIGQQGDIFSLNTLTQGIKSLRIGPCSGAGIAIFVFMLLGRAGIYDSELGCALFQNGELMEYQGIQRAVLYLSTAFRMFILVALVTHIFFPWWLFRSEEAAATNLVWYMQALNFSAFWAAVIAVRVVLVPLCGKVLGLLCGLLPKRIAWLPFPLFTIAAMTLVVYGAVRFAPAMAVL